MMSDLTGRSDQRALGHISAQIKAAESGAQLATSMVEGDVATDKAREQMQLLEHEGDDHRRRLVKALSHALTTPIDREDLYRLSRSVDDVLDNLRDYVRETDLYAPEAQRGVPEMLTAVAAGMRELDEAVDCLVARPTLAKAHAIAARKEANAVRMLYQHRLAELFIDPVDAETLKRRELLRRLDIVALRINEAADALNDGVFKRSL